MAKKLYEEIGKADEDSLKQMLKQLMDKYFGIQPAEPAGSGLTAGCLLCLPESDDQDLQEYDRESDDDACNVQESEIGECH